MDATRIHGKTCEKQSHAKRGGYLHDEDYDGPYDVDGIAYCGRCHFTLGIPDGAGTILRSSAPDPTTPDPWLVEAQGIVDAAFSEAEHIEERILASQADEPCPRIDYNGRGENLLVAHIARALRAAAGPKSGTMGHDQLHSRIAGAIKNAIDAHGPITVEWISSATKRVQAIVWPLVRDTATPPLPDAVRETIAVVRAVVAIVRGMDVDIMGDHPALPIIDDAAVQLDRALARLDAATGAGGTNG